MFSHLFWHQGLAAWAQWFWPAFANHLWQTTLIALFAGLVMTLLKRAPARVRYVAWLLVLAKLLLPSALLLWLAQGGIGWLTRLLPAAELPSASFALVFENAQPLGEFAAPFATLELGKGAALASHNEFYCLLTGVWLLGAGLLLTGWLSRRRRFAQALRNSQPLNTGREFECLQRLRARLSYQHNVVLLPAPRLTEPGVWRIWQPVIAWPEGMAERLSDAELEAVLLHELLHIRHRDNLLATVQMWVCCLCWFHPLVWWLDRRLLAEREWVCDEAVLRWQGAPQIYAASLWKVAQFGLGWPSTNMAGVSRVGGSNLKRRIEAMLQNEFPTRLAWPQRFLIGFTVAALLVFSCVIALPLRNQALAQDKPPTVSGNVIEDGGPQDGIKGGVADGVADGIKQGIAINVKGGVANGIAGGVNGNKAVRSLVAEPQDVKPADRLNHWDAIAQAPEFPIRIDSASAPPLLIHKAVVKTMLEESYQPFVTAEQGDNQATLISQFLLTLTNQASLAIKSVECEFTHPRIRAVRLTTEFKKPIPPTAMIEVGNERTLYYRLNPGPFNPTDFTARITIVEYEDGSFWVAGAGHIPNSAGASKTQALIEQLGRMRQQLDQSTAANQTTVAAQGEEEVYKASADLRPVITYREKAGYTKEARDNKVEGIVILSVIFRRNGKLTDISVVRGLPDGLTEQAVAAAQKIRFDPAIKDGQPVSVRANLEYGFSLLEKK